MSVMEKSYLCMLMAYVQPRENTDLPFFNRKERATSQNNQLLPQPSDKHLWSLSQYLCASGFICFQVS